MLSSLLEWRISTLIQVIAAKDPLVMITSAASSLINVNTAKKLLITANVQTPGSGEGCNATWSSEKVGQGEVNLLSSRPILTTYAKVSQFEYCCQYPSARIAISLLLALWIIVIFC